MHWHGVHIFWLEVMTAKSHSMNPLVIASRDSITPKMKKLKSLLVLNSTQLEKRQSLAILTDFTCTTLIQKDLNGMRFAVKSLKTTTLLLLVLGKLMGQKLVLVHYVDQWMSLTFVLRNQNTKENLNSLMFLFHKLLWRESKTDKELFWNQTWAMKFQRLTFIKIDTWLLQLTVHFFLEIWIPVSFQNYLGEEVEMRSTISQTLISAWFSMLVNLALSSMALTKSSELAELKTSTQTWFLQDLTILSKLWEVVNLLRS